MSMMTLFILVTLLLNAALGLFVYFTNPRRAVNQQFVLVAGVISLWAYCINQVFLSADLRQAEFWIRVSSGACILVPTAFRFLRVAITSESNRWYQILGRYPGWLLLNAVFIAFCQTHTFLRGAVMPEPGLDVPPRAVYGPGLYPFVAYYVACWVVVVWEFLWHLRRTHGMKRAELQFLLLGLATGSFFGVLFALILPMVTGDYVYTQIAPFCIMICDATIAYGIATQRILEVAEILRRSTAYALLTAYLVLLYTATWLPAHLALRPFLPASSSLFGHMIAALIVAFSMVPAHGHLQRFANRLFINVQPMDVGRVVQQMSRILDSITTLDDLLQRFARNMAEAVGTDRVTILLAGAGGYVQRYPPPEDERRPVLPAGSPLLKTLDARHEPIVGEIIQRHRHSPGLEEAGHELSGLHAAMAAGIRAKGGLAGILLLGPKLSGRIYGSLEQDAIQVLCNQLAVALENAKLYTQIQESKIYNDILLDNLVSGVVASDADGVITVFNREAQRITRIHAADVLGHSLDALPEPLADALRDVMQTHVGRRDRDLSIRLRSGEDVVVRVGSCVFHGQAGKVAGALLVFNDMTTIRKLELQVRRTDRLASIGTISAGMAHEIKNPLVTLKTFTQLLPERYDDPDFRETFSQLIGQEIKRIDGIVNQLLRFSRPAKPNLTPIHLHEVIDNSLLLVGQQLRQRGIELVRDLSAPNDVIEGDADQLNQALINFLLNAIESMAGGGSVMVATTLLQTGGDAEYAWPPGGANGDSQIRVSIADTGGGIPREMLGQIFDPFFTTKSHGTGLGLTVANGIITEHRGVIDVDSEVGHGTTFHVSFPLLGKEAMV